MDGRASGVAPSLPRPALVVGQQRLRCLSLSFPTPPPHPEICYDNKCDCGYDYVYKTNVMENFIIIIVAYGEGEE